MTKKETAMKPAKPNNIHKDKANTRIIQPDTKTKLSPWWKIIITVFILIILVAVVWFVSAWNDNSGSKKETINYEIVGGVTESDITIKTGSGAISIDSDGMANLLKAKIEGDNLRLQKDSRHNGGTQIITLSNDNSNWFMGARNSSWNITLNQLLPQKITREAGASSIDADLSNVKLTNLSVKVGASRSTIIIGDKQSRSNINYESGASSMTLRIPKDSGVIMKLDEGLGVQEFEDLNKVSDGEYKSKNYDTAKNTIIINASTGVTSFKIERY